MTIELCKRRRRRTTTTTVEFINLLGEERARE